MGRKNKLLFELPFTLESPRLTSPSVGISRLIQRRSGSFDREISLLDTSDHRLMRAGVTLEHRVVDGRGEWALDAPSWQPWLPAEHVEPMGGSGDLPDDLAFLIRPFRRLAALGTVAAITQQRVSYVIEDDEGTDLGTLRDERITIRRGGVTTARFREAMLHPSAAMNAEQRTFVVEALVSVGAVPVAHFPEALKRLGAPGTGLTDFPEPRPIDKKTSLEHCVSSLFASRLRDIVRADLALRAADLVRQSRAGQSGAGQSGAGQSSEPALTVAPLLDELQTLRSQVHALSGVLQPAWREALEADLDQVLATAASSPVGSLGERYYVVLDTLILAVRAPQLGDHSHQQATEVLRAQAERRTQVLAGRVHDLTVDSDDSDWAAALFAARELADSVTAVGVIGGRRAAKLGKQLRHLLTLLEPACVDVGMPTDQQLRGLGVRAAFERGMQVQRGVDARTAARRATIEVWPEIRAKLLRLRGRR